MPPVTIFAHLAAWLGSKRLTEMILPGEPLSAASALTSQLHHAAESVYRNSNWRRSEDFLEAVDARREKRRPVFTGR